MLHPLRPAHLADVDEALDALLELDERAVVGERDDLALDARADRILLVGAVPRVLLDLLQAEADALGGRVELEDDDTDLLADLEHLRRVADAAPAHVGDVEQAVDAAEVDEGAVVGQVLHLALEDRALLQVLQGLLLQLLALLLEEDPARQDDVAALLVELDDLELELLADELVEVPHRADVDLRAGRNAFTPMSTERPPFTRPTITPSTSSSRSHAAEISSQMRILSAFSLERTTIPVSFSRDSTSTSTLSPTFTAGSPPGAEMNSRSAPGPRTCSRCR